MDRYKIIDTIGSKYYTSNIEGGEYSYIKEANGRRKLQKILGRTFTHFKLDIRFEKDDVVVLVETKASFEDKDRLQLLDYVEEEKALHPTKKIIAMLANTDDDKIKVWKSVIDDDHILTNETVLLDMEHYARLFDVNPQNDRETVLKNTLALNELLHKKDIDEKLRSQFVGTTLLYIKKEVKQRGASVIDESLKEQLNAAWNYMSEEQICAGIKATLTSLLDGSDNKEKKIELLQRNVLENQKVKNLKRKDWIEILNTILMDIYQYINADSSEGQDILNMFFIAFNKYTGKADKNQAFTPDHITDFMCRVTGVDHTKVVLDITCGSGSFLVQALVQELAGCRKGRSEQEAEHLMRIVKEKHIYGIEFEDNAYGLATTNMLIHGDGNSNIKNANCFDCEDFIINADPDIILMNPPYNSKPINIPANYKKAWDKKAKEGKEDPTKGFVFLQFLSDVVKKMNDQKESQGLPRKIVKLAVLLPVSAAIGNSNILKLIKTKMLEENKLEAVFTLPPEIFYPGASVNACCMLFSLGKRHVNDDGTIDETFFGFYREDGFVKKKNLGRVEQFTLSGDSKWIEIEKNWLKLFRNKTIVDGMSAKAIVGGYDEWLCEAYMKTDYSKLKVEDFQKTLNNYIAYLAKTGKHYES